MEFLTSAYDSDEDDNNNTSDKEVSPPASSLPRKTIPLIKKEEGHGTRKVTLGEKPKKRLDISFLPPEIQEALLKGGVGEDSDEEEEQQEGSRKKTKSSEVIPNNKAKEATNRLLRALPAPKHSQQLPLDSLPFVPPVPIQSQSTQSQPESVSPPTQTKAAGGREAPALPIPSLTNPFSFPTPSLNLVLPPPQRSLTTSSSEANVQEPQHSMADREVEEPAAKNKRKRERELEQQLMAGDTSAIANANVVEVGAFNNWDARSYVDQQVREASIMQAYTAGGALKSVLQPTKAQNRKHQLSSLALKAAETEIALLEARGQRVKSKAQTQGRYGW
eukprot:gene258-277_t